MTELSPTVGWVHNGHLIDRYPKAVTSMDHARRLHHIHTVAAGLIQITIAAAGLASGAGALEVQPTSSSDAHGWRRITLPKGAGLSHQDLLGVRSSLAEVGLTMEDYAKVRNSESEGNLSTRTLLTVARESGFRDPIGLLTVAPVMCQSESDIMDHYIPKQREIDPSQVDLYLGLLPDVASARGQMQAAGSEHQ